MNKKNSNLLMFSCKIMEPKRDLLNKTCKAIHFMPDRIQSFLKKEYWSLKNKIKRRTLILKMFCCKWTIRFQTVWCLGLNHVQAQIQEDWVHTSNIMVRLMPLRILICNNKYLSKLILELPVGWKIIFKVKLTNIPLICFQMSMNHSKIQTRIFYQLCHELEITLILKAMLEEQKKVGNLKELEVEEQALDKKKFKVVE